MNLKEYIHSQIKSQLRESVVTEATGFKIGDKVKITKFIQDVENEETGDLHNFNPGDKVEITNIDGKHSYQFKYLDKLPNERYWALQKEFKANVIKESVNEAKKKLPKFKNIPSWAKYLAQHSDGEWTWYEETPTMIKFKDGSGGAWKQDGNQTYTGVKTDGKDWDKIPTYYYVKNGVVTEAAERDYKKEYAKYGKSEKSKKYRAELNKYNRDKGTYGNGDGKDASHKDGKIVGFESESKNRGRAEKSRLKKESVNESPDVNSLKKNT